MYYEFGTKGSYWSTQRTMCRLVDTIIAPYFMSQKGCLNLPPEQKAVWQIDVWSVHRSQEFRDWMRANHNNILLHFVPGGCTPVLQACDVGIQRILKHSLKRSYHRDVVNDVLDQLDKGAEQIRISKSVTVLRDRSVTWIWEAYQALNKEHIVKNVRFSCQDPDSRSSLYLQAFQKCAVGDFNLSFESLRSREARDRLRELKVTDRELWDELTAYDRIDPVPGSDTAVPEDKGAEEDTEEGVEDDSNVPLDAVIAHVVGNHSFAGIRILPESGVLASSGEAELSTADENGESSKENLGRGKRKRVKRDLGKYNGEQFWC